MTAVLAHQLLPVVERLYAAAAREITLDDAFASLAELMGDFVGSLFVHDPISGETALEACVGIDRHWVEEYNARWQSSNPLVLRSLPELMAGKIINSDEVMPWSELSATAYGREFFVSIGARYSMSALVAGQAQRYASYVSARAEAAGPYLPWHYELLEASRAHLGRTLHILEFFEGARLSLHLFRSSMDSLPFSVLLLDDARRIIYGR